MQTIRLLALLLVAPCVPGAALGQGAPAPAVKADPVAAAAEKAKRAFEDGRYEEAVLAYREAYRLEPVTTLLYNIAFLYDAHLNERALAVDYYRRFVNAPDAAPESKVKAYERITLLDKQMRRERAAKAVEMLGTGDPVAATVTPTPTPAVKAAVDGPVASARTETDDGVDPLGVTLLGVGGAALVTGAVFAVLNAGTHADFEDEPTRAGKLDLADRGKTQALVADISIGVGAALAATGLILILTDDGGGVAPSASNAGGGLTFSGRF